MSNARELAELGGSYGTGGFVGMKNRIINGAMMIDQRNAGASVTPAGVGGTYIADRWLATTGAASKLTFQVVADAPTGFKNSLKVTVASQYAPASGNQFHLQQRIEGVNIIDLQFGTSGAVTITTSFQVKSSVTGTYSCFIWNGDFTRSYVATYTISSANTWTPLVLTIAGSTSGTWATDASAGLTLGFDLGSGSNLNATEGVWNSTFYTRTAGSVTFVNQTGGATWQLAAVQLEKGSTATSFDYRPYGTELALCQRYYETGSVWGVSYSASAAAIQRCQCPFQTVKRANPTNTVTVAAGSLTSPTFLDTRTNMGWIGFSAASSSLEGLFSYTSSAEL